MCPNILTNFMYLLKKKHLFSNLFNSLHLGLYYHLNDGRIVVCCCFKTHGKIWGHHLTFRFFKGQYNMSDGGAQPWYIGMDFNSRNSTDVPLQVRFCMFFEFGYWVTLWCEQLTRGLMKTVYSNMYLLHVCERQVFSIQYYWCLLEDFGVTTWRSPAAYCDVSFYFFRIFLLS